VSPKHTQTNPVPFFVEERVVLEPNFFYDEKEYKTKGLSSF